MSSYENEAPPDEAYDNSYVSRPGNKGEAVPVQSDQDVVHDPINENTADSDEQLGMASPPCFIHPLLPAPTSLRPA